MSKKAETTSPLNYAVRNNCIICCLVNIIFHEDFVIDLKTVNDIKSQKDIETANTYGMFWIKVGCAFNSCVDDHLIKK
jgi:hypothetical protein